MPRFHIPRELVPVVELALSQGWRMRMTDNNHTILYPPDRSKSPITISSYKSSRGGGKRGGGNKGIQNAQRDLERAGLIFERVR